MVLFQLSEIGDTRGLAIPAALTYLINTILDDSLGAVYCARFPVVRLPFFISFKENSRCDVRGPK